MIAQSSLHRAAEKLEGAIKFCDKLARRRPSLWLPNASGANPHNALASYVSLE